MDIMESITESIEGDQYIVSFLDDYMHPCAIFTMRNPSNVGQVFIEYERKATAKFNRNIVIIRCDKASEYIGGMFKDHCNMRGIILQETELYEYESSQGWNRLLQEKM